MDNTKAWQFILSCFFYLLRWTNVVTNKKYRRFGISKWNLWQFSTKLLEAVYKMIKKSIFKCPLIFLIAQNEKMTAPCDLSFSHYAQIPKGFNNNSHGCNPWKTNDIRREPRSGFNSWFALNAIFLILGLMLWRDLLIRKTGSFKWIRIFTPILLYIFKKWWNKRF